MVLTQDKAPVSRLAQGRRAMLNQKNVKRHCHHTPQKRDIQEHIELLRQNTRIRIPFFDRNNESHPINVLIDRQTNRPTDKNKKERRFLQTKIATSSSIRFNPKPIVDTQIHQTVLVDCRLVVDCCVVIVIFIIISVLVA
jgi:hypothetical protein